MLKPIITKIGSGKPSIAIVGCLHGDEIIGKKVIQALEKTSVDKGSITFIIAHPEALQKKKRFVSKDLNRSFPGKRNGNIEEKIAFGLLPILKKFDLVIDIHATNSDFKDLAIVAQLRKKEKALLRMVPITKVALVHKTTFGGFEMIRFCRQGVSLEYGPDKTGKNWKFALAHIKNMLIHLKMIKGVKKTSKKKDLYVVKGVYPVEKDFKQNKNLKNFALIKKGSVIGTLKKKQIVSDRSFYPLFLGKGKYEKTLSLVSSKQKLIIK